MFVANAGDSRCVLCRDGVAVDLSVDHKPEDDSERTRIEAAGGKVTNDGRVNGGLNLSRALGGQIHIPVFDIDTKFYVCLSLFSFESSEKAFFLDTCKLLNYIQGSEMWEKYAPRHFSLPEIK